MKNIHADLARAEETARGCITQALQALAARDIARLVVLYHRADSAATEAKLAQDKLASMARGMLGEREIIKRAADRVKNTATWAAELRGMVAAARALIPSP